MIYWWKVFQFKLFTRYDVFESKKIQLYRFYRNRVNRAVKRARAHFYKTQVKNLKICNRRQWWKHTKQLTSLGRKWSGLQGLANSTTNGNLADLADQINIFFESVCEDITHLTKSSYPNLLTYPSQINASYILLQLRNCYQISRSTKLPNQMQYLTGFCRTFVAH